MVASGTPNPVSMLLGRGDGTFGPKTDYGAGSYPTSVAVADVNGDGRPDVAVGNGSSSSVSVLLNLRNTVPVAVEDLQATVHEDRVLLTWRLGAEAERHLFGVDVQRAENVSGPYVELSSSPLEPNISMSFEDSGVEQARTYWYRLVLRWKDGSDSTTSPISVTAVGGSWLTSLSVAAPPANGPVEIRYRIGRSGTPVRLEIYDVAGRRIRLLERSVRDRGEYVHWWNRLNDSGRHVVRGVYLVRLKAGNVRISEKLVLYR